jgi:hypothetical protein
MMFTTSSRPHGSTGIWKSVDGSESTAMAPPRMISTGSYRANMAACPAASELPPAAEPAESRVGKAMPPDATAAPAPGGITGDDLFIGETGRHNITNELLRCSYTNTTAVEAAAATTTLQQQQRQQRHELTRESAVPAAVSDAKVVDVHKVHVAGRRRYTRRWCVADAHHVRKVHLQAERQSQGRR